MTRPVDGYDERLLAVYRETIDPLYRYVSRCCGGDRALAEDVTQETWLRAVRDWRRAGPPGEPMAWLATVARNLLVSYYRRHRPAALDTLAREPAARDDVGGAFEEAETVTTVQHALARLPAPQAQLIETFHFDDRSTADIAQASGVSPRAVEGRLRRARQRLRRELESLLGIKGAPR